MTARLLVTIVLVFAATACGGRCKSWTAIAAAKQRLAADDERALGAALAERSLVLVTPKHHEDEFQRDYRPRPPGWAVIELPADDDADAATWVLESAANPPRLVRDAEGTIHVLVTGPTEQRNMEVCGCDPGQGTESPTPVWRVALSSPDGFGPPIEVPVVLHVIETRYERRTGAPGECFSAP